MQAIYTEKYSAWKAHAGNHALAADAWGDPDTPYVLPPDPVAIVTREYWMRRAVVALSDLNDGSPCPFAAFGCVIVNHSAISTGNGELGEEVCTGANAIMKDGNPTLHGAYTNYRSLFLIMAWLSL